MLIPPPFILKPRIKGMKDIGSGSVVIEGFHPRTHRNKMIVVCTDHRSKQSQGRWEFIKPSGMLRGSDVQIFGIHQGIRAHLEVGELRNPTVNFICPCPRSSPSVKGPPVRPFPGSRSTRTFRLNPLFPATPSNSLALAG